MDKTIELLTAWAAFQKARPSATLADFCAHYLSGEQQAAKKGKRTAEEAGTKPTRYALSRTINRLSRLWMHFTGAALKPVGLGSFEELTFLLTVEGRQPIRKKDLIGLHYLEMSSGLLVIERLVKKGLLAEVSDVHDKRSKLVSITKTGSATLKQGRAALDAVSAALYDGMGEPQMVECLAHLTPLESRMGERWQKSKRALPE